MKIGITGHQARKGLDWKWARTSVRRVFEELSPVEFAISCLAVGSDQLFAEEALSADIELRVILPFEFYDLCFKGQALAKYQTLLNRSTSVCVLSGAKDHELSFLIAGQEIVRQCDVLVAIWDGQTAAGTGGTADIVEFAKQQGRSIRWINPLARTLAILQ